MTLEIGSSARSSVIDRMSLRVSCDDDRAQLSLDDPVTEKVLLRTIPFVRARAGRERTLALAASQLLLASFAELLLAPRDSQDEPELSEEGRVARAAAVAASDRYSDLELSVLGAIRVRDWREPIATYAVGGWIRYAAMRHLGIVGRLGFELGRASRQAGDVLMRIGSASLGIDYEWFFSGSFDLRSSVYLSLLYVHLLGEADVTNFGGDTTDGLSAEGVLGTTASLRFDPFRVGVGIELGFAASTVVGLVDEETSVDPGGFWAGGTLHLGVQL